MNKRSLSSRRFEGTKFLYVDDEPDNLTGFRLHLEEYFDILTESDPRKALDRIQDEPDLAVLIVDQVMPFMTGMELAEAAHKLNPTLTCIMLTGNATKQLAIDSVRTRLFWEFMEKPVDFSSTEIHQTFISAIQEHLLQRVKHDYREGTIELLAHLIDDKDGHTHKHSERVTNWAVRIGERMGLSERDLMVVREGAMLHDIGKISIPDDILKKPGRLTELERKIIMTHPGRGGELLERIPQLRELAFIARDHHERPDGSGYPKGLARDEVPLMASIVALADFFEALSSRRPYKDPWPMGKIVTECARLRDQQFPSAVIDVLFELLEEDGLMTQAEIKACCQEAA